MGREWHAALRGRARSQRRRTKHWPAPALRGLCAIKGIAPRKIGRNVVKFQKIEAMLKVFVSRTNFKGPIGKSAEILEDRKHLVQKQSLGKLAKDYLKSLSSKTGRVHECPEDRGQAWASLSVKVKNEDERSPQQMAAFNILLSERNRLIPQMPADFDPNSTHSGMALITELDKQNEIIERDYIYRRHLLGALQEAKKVMLKEFEK